jgi:predicted dehydrogenase
MPTISPASSPAWSSTASAADLDAFVPGRRLDDNANVMLRFKGGAKGMLWASQVAPGHENGLKLRVYGDQGRPRMGAGRSELPLVHAFGQPKQLITRGTGVGAGPPQPA